MQGFTSATRSACTLVENDWFKMGGQLYRILQTETVDRSTNLWFNHPQDSNDTCVMTLPSAYPIKTYTQNISPYARFSGRRTPRTRRAQPEPSPC